MIVALQIFFLLILKDDNVTVTWQFPLLDANGMSSLVLGVLEKDAYEFSSVWGESYLSLVSRRFPVFGEGDISTY